MEYRPKQFELFYSGLAGTISVRNVKDALFLSKESEDLYFDVIEIAAVEQLKADLRMSDLNRQSLWADSLKLVDENAALKSKLAEAKETLEFYGSPKTYFYVEHPDGLEGRGGITVMKDLGSKAINALSEIGEG